MYCYKYLFSLPISLCQLNSLNSVGKEKREKPTKPRHILKRLNIQQEDTVQTEMELQQEDIVQTEMGQKEILERKLFIED